MDIIKIKTAAWKGISNLTALFLLYFLVGFLVTSLIGHEPITILPALSGLYLFFYKYVISTQKYRFYLLIYFFIIFLLISFEDISTYVGLETSVEKFDNQLRNLFGFIKPASVISVAILYRLITLDGRLVGEVAPENDSNYKLDTDSR